MNKNGFVTSALLYGILSLFLVLILGTVAIIGNRKITNDKIKQSALDDVQKIETPDECFVTNTNENGNLTIIGYNPEANADICTKTVFIPEYIDSVVVDSIGENAFLNAGLINVTIKENIKTIEENAFSGNPGILFIIKGSAINYTNENGTIWGATGALLRKDL